MPITSAALLGIQDHGLSWRGSIHLQIPDNIPKRIDELELTSEVNSFIDAIVKYIYHRLDNKAHSLRLPQDAGTALNVLVSDFKETLVADVLEAAPEKVVEADVVETKVEDLMHFLNDLYDWADYHRIIIKTNS